LLLSIHHDDVQPIYHVTWSHEAVARFYSDRFSGYSLLVSRNNKRFDDSLAFAKLLGNELFRRGMRYSSHHAEPIPGEGRQIVDTAAGVYQYNELYVLKFSAAPAVLLEAGIIVNRIEETVLASPEGRGLISAAAVAAMSAYCSGHRGGQLGTPGELVRQEICPWSAACAHRLIAP
jgi:N-acetylmuramoyl-L-alanine amidase